MGVMDTFVILMVVMVSLVYKYIETSVFNVFCLLYVQYISIKLLKISKKRLSQHYIETLK